MEGARACQRAKLAMTAGAQFRSGKGAGDENFPVASRLIRRQHRPVIVAFYDFVRVADDIADHALLSGGEKLAQLDRLEASLLGRSDEEPQGKRLRGLLQARSSTPVHAQHLLRAFRQDVTKRRYETWDELIGYCQYSAMPVGRFVLDVHGEPQSTWPASDALCAALQIINHIQDCGADYRALDRVYIPLDMLAAGGADVKDLGNAAATPALRATVRRLTERTAKLLKQGRPLAGLVADNRLAMEIAAIQSLAERLITLLQIRDPLRERARLSRLEMLLRASEAALRTGTRRLFTRSAPSLSAVSQ